MDILLIEDSARVADFLIRGLRAEGWLVTHAAEGEGALRLLSDSAFDVVVLDRMLPDIPGEELCRQLRARGDRTPILMLTALDGVEERVSGLRSGADDYLAKPFDFDELLARLEALVRRATEFAPVGQDVIRAGALSFDPGTLEIRLADRPLELTATERELLTLFLRKPGQILSRERILNTVWGTGEDPYTNIVDVYIGRLRRKLGSEGAMLRTVRGVGYRLDPE